jgi:cbb3-type cytochrome oxidase cytochrome c subunit
LNAKGDDIDDSDINQNNNRVRELNNIINAPITREEIEKAIKSLKNNKSSGDDYILNEYKNIYHLSRFQMSMLNYLISYLTVDSFQNSGYMGMLFLFTKIMKINMILKMLGRSRF